MPVEYEMTLCADESDQKDPCLWSGCRCLPLIARLCLQLRSLSFSSASGVKARRGKALHEKPRQEEVHPAALGPALHRNLGFVWRQKRLLDIPHHGPNVLRVFRERLVSAL